MNKYTDEILIEALNELDSDESIIDYDDDMCIDYIMDNDESIIEESIF